MVLQKNANVFSQATYNDLLHHTFNISSFQHDVTVSNLINIYNISKSRSVSFL